MNSIACPTCHGEQVITHNEKIKVNDKKTIVFHDEEECPTCNGQGVIPRTTLHLH